MKLTIGMDVSKDELDAHKLANGKYIEVGNNATGFKRLPNGWVTIRTR